MYCQLCQKEIAGYYTVVRNHIGKIFFCSDAHEYTYLKGATSCQHPNGTNQQSHNSVSTQPAGRASPIPTLA